MTPIRVLVATTHRDIKAELIRSIVAAEPDMRLLEEDVLIVPEGEVEPILAAIPIGEPCALIWVGGAFDTRADQWLKFRPLLVLVLVNVVGDFVQLGVRNPDGQSMVAAVFALVKHAGAGSTQRITQIELTTPDPPYPQETPPPAKYEFSPDESGGPPFTSREPAATQEPSSSVPESTGRTRRPASRTMPLIAASVRWVRSVLRSAVTSFQVTPGDTPGYSVTRDTLLRSLDQHAAICITDGSMLIE